MFGITQRTAGDFIDLDNYFRFSRDETLDISERGDYATKFLLLLLGSDTIDYDGFDIKDYESEIVEIKGNFEYIFNPPPMPSSTNQDAATIGSEYRKEFAEIYGGYVELVYLISTVFGYKPNEVLEMKCQDFLFWGNYLLHKKYVENIK